MFSLFLSLLLFLFSKFLLREYTDSRFIFLHVSSHREHLHPAPLPVDIAILISPSLPLVIYELYHILPTNETRTRACSRAAV